jgi:DNA-binding beta-propeller fold protein YncE
MKITCRLSSGAAAAASQSPMQNVFMKPKAILSLVCSSLLIIPRFVSAADSLTPGHPMEVIGTQGKFDFIKIDSVNHRLLACHTGNGSLDVIDDITSKLIKSIPIGNAQGIAIDSKNNRYFVSVSKPTKMVIVDSTKLDVIGEVVLPGPADLIAYHSETNRVFVCNDNKPEMWVIDPMEKKVVSTISFPGGGMEDLGFDSRDTFLFQCLKDSNELAKLDLKTEKIVAKWSTSPVDQPHGMAMVPGADQVLIVGGMGKLGLFNLSTGQIIGTTEVSPKVDEIAFDPALHRVYCASGLGTISVVGLNQQSLAPLSSLTSSLGAHSIAVDSQTHTVWIAFAKKDKAYVQAFTTK